MPDPTSDNSNRPPGLPAPGAAPTFVPTQAALDRALTRARHRKLTRGLALSLAVLAVPAAVVFGLPDRQRQDSLQFAETPSPQTSTTTAPDAQPTPSPPAPPPTGIPETAPSPAGAPEGEAATAPPTRARPNDQQPSAAPGPSGQKQGATRPAHVESPREVPGRDCGQVQDGGSGLSTNRAGCIRGRAPFTAQRGAPVDLITSFCLSPYRTDPALLEFRGGQEHEILIREQDRDADGFVTGRGKILWTWSRTVTFTQGPHTRTLAPDRCLEWTTRWRTQDQAGSTLPAGEYFVEYRMTASDPWGGTMGSTINVTD